MDRFSENSYALTLVDTLDTLYILGDFQEFEAAIGRVLKDVSFDTNVTVNLFEVNIRVLGGMCHDRPGT